MEKDITLELFNSPDPGSGKTRIMLTEDFGKSSMISAALAIRHANLPYSPVLHDETPTIPYADVEFQIEDSNEAITVQKSIHATMRFPQNPEMETLTFEAALFIGGDDEYDAHIRYTPEFRMNHAELADILHDAYYDASVNEDAFPEWDDLKHERRLFQERMDYLATGILDGRESAFKQALSDYLQRFDPGVMAYPESSVETVTGDRHGKITAVFTPPGLENGNTETQG